MKRTTLLTALAIVSAIIIVTNSTTAFGASMSSLIDYYPSVTLLPNTDGNSTSGGSGGGTSSPVGLTSNFSVSSGAYLPDKGVSWNTYFSNREESANAYFSTTVFNDGKSGRYFVPTDSYSSISQTYSYKGSDPGLREFSTQTTYLIVDAAPTAEEFEYVTVDQEYDADGFRISMRGTIRNGYDYIWPERNEDGSYDEPTQIVTADIETWTSIYIDSPSAEIYGISCDVDERSYSWENEEYLVISMNGTFHTPEPATLALLAIGGLTILRRRRQRQ